ncbi:MAG TPA: hypothetical protein VGF79_06780 [Bacteroidia bacterium]
MIEFSVDNYNITVYVGQTPTILEHYKQQAVFIDDKDLKNEGTEVYVIISTDTLKTETRIIAFKTDPIGYGGFIPGIHFEKDSQTVFIGAGTIIKTIRLTDNKIIFEKNSGLGFWGWSKHKDYILQQEEIDFGVFNLEGVQLWETSVSPPYYFEINGDKIMLKFDDIVETRSLLTGEIS